MNKKLITGGVAAGLLVATGAAGIAVAQSTATPELSMAQAIEIALAEVPGQVQETELEWEYGSQIYEVEILTADGVEMEIEIDASTGEILEIEADEDDSDDDEQAG